MDLSRATVLITGSTDGVGRVVARRLAASGARVRVHGRRNTKGRAAIEEIRRSERQRLQRLALERTGQPVDAAR